VSEFIDTAKFYKSKFFELALSSSVILLSDQSLHNLRHIIKSTERRYHSWKSCKQLFVTWTKRCRRHQRQRQRKQTKETGKKPKVRL